MGFVNTYNEFLIEKLSKSDREKLDDSDFVFPERRAWPIHTKKQAQLL